MSKEHPPRKIGRPPKPEHEKKGRGFTVYLLPDECEYVTKTQETEGAIDRSSAVGKIVRKAMLYDELLAKASEEAKKAKRSRSVPINALEKSLSDTMKAYEAVKRDLEELRSLAMLQKKGNPDA